MGGPLFTVCKSRAEWLEHRRDGLGASDAPAVLGVSPWKTNEALWEERVGVRAPEDVGDNPRVRYGNDAEPLLRAFFALDHPEYEVAFTPFKIFRHPDKPFITCTPDGELVERATGLGGGLEIKTTEILSSAGWVKWKDRIPDEYYIQVLHQMLAAGWDFVELLVQIKYRIYGAPARCVATGGERRSGGMNDTCPSGQGERYAARDDEAAGEDRKEVRHYRINRADVLGDLEVVEREVTAFWNCVTEKRKPSLKLPPI